jgi:single-strand DNA-binding protein
VARGSLAEICQEHLCKGQRVFVEGRLQTRRWDGAEGRKHPSVEIVAREMIILGDPQEAPAAAGEEEPFSE